MTAGFADFVEQLIAELLGGTSPPDLPPPPLQTAFPDSVVEPGYVLDMQADALTNTITNDLATREPFKSMAFAVVDLSSRSLAGPLPPPRFAGNLVQSQRQVDSMAKIAVMLAAHSLRAEVQFLAASGAFSDLVGLAIGHTQRLMTAPEQVVRDAAKPTVVKDIVADEAGQQFRTLQGGPEVRRILDLTYDTGGWKVAFKSSNLTPAKLKEIELAGDRERIAALPFAERMRLMVRFSGDLAAASCIRDLGFPYIAALLRQTGLFDLPSQHGLWVARNYDHHVWDTQGTLFASVPLTDRQQACTPSAAAAFMTLLFQRRLLADVDANVDMRHLLRDNTEGFVSFFAPDPSRPSDVRQPRRDPGTAYYSKVGFVTRFSEAALVERWVSDTLTLRYVLTVASASSSQDMRELAVEVDKRLLALHP
jgi:hypothetical protein